MTKIQALGTFYYLNTLAARLEQAGDLAGATQARLLAGHISYVWSLSEEDIARGDVR